MLFENKILKKYNNDNASLYVQIFMKIDIDSSRMDDKITSILHQNDVIKSKTCIQ